MHELLQFVARWEAMLRRKLNDPDTLLEEHRIGHDDERSNCAMDQFESISQFVGRVRFERLGPYAQRQCSSLCRLQCDRPQRTRRISKDSYSGQPWNQLF